MFFISKNLFFQKLNFLEKSFPKKKKTTPIVSKLKYANLITL